MKRLFLSAVLVLTAGMLYAQPTPANIATLRYYDANLIGRIPTGVATPTAMAFDGVHMWVVGNAGPNFLAASVKSFTVTGEYYNNTYSAVGAYPWGAAWDGQRIWVTSSPENAVYTYDPILQQTKTYPVPSGSRGIAFDGKRMWIANMTHNCI